MANHKETILEQLIISLESLQILEDSDIAIIHQLDTSANLEKCTQQLIRLMKQLEIYRSNDLIGTITPIGMITGIRKNGWHQISEYKINSQWMKAKEYRQAISEKVMIETIEAR